MPPQYKSTAEVLVVNPKVQSETTMRPLEGGPDASAMSTEIALIQSKSLALRVAKELGLDKEPKFPQRSAIAQLLARLGLSQMLESLGLSPQRRSDKAPSPGAVPDLPSTASDEHPSPALDAAAEELRQRIQVERLGSVLRFVDFHHNAGSDPIPADRRLHCQKLFCRGTGGPK